jgi:hypothetical protein
MATTLMRPYLELEKKIAEALGWKEVTIHGDLEFGGWPNSWHNQTVLYGCPPDVDIVTHLPNYPVPRFIYEGKILNLLDELEINIEWYTDSVSAVDSDQRIASEANEALNGHPNKKIALHTAICKMVLAIKNYKPTEA